ncbi:MAG TPA: TonB family protein [Pseudomonadales bacterium]|nr:TonB family protein [Pseudomonadales bacterium]
MMMTRMESGTPQGMLRTSLVDTGEHPRIDASVHAADPQIDADADAAPGYAPPRLRSPVPRDCAAILQTPHEGWVLLDFDIDACGHIVSATVVGSSGEPGFEDAARDAVANWLFRPALVCGRLAIPATCRELLRVRIERGEGFGTTFRETLESALWMIRGAADRGFVALVEGELAVLAVRPVERAHLALLQADVARMRGAPQQEIEALRRALTGGGAHLARCVRSLALQRLLRLELEFEFRERALATAERLSTDEDVRAPLPDSIRAWLAELGASRAGGQETSTDRALAWRLPWFDQVLLADPAWIVPPSAEQGVGGRLVRTV